MSLHDTRVVGDVKIVMLKGEKGDRGATGNAEWGSVEGNIADQTDLQQALYGKSDTGHSHTIGDIQSLQTELDGKADESDMTTALAGKANTSHTHAIADVSGLQTALDGKASSSHGHAIADVSGLQTALDGKASSSHSHAIADVSGLQTALDGKASSSHSHAIADVSGLQTALDGKASNSHSHAISDVTNLQATLNGKMGFSYVTQTVSVNGSESSPMSININALTTGVLTIVAINATSYNYADNYGQTFLPSGGTYCVIEKAGEGTKILAGGTSLETFSTPSSHNTVQKVYAIIRLS